MMAYEKTIFKDLVRAVTSLFSDYLRSRVKRVELLVVIFVMLRGSIRYLAIEMFLAVFPTIC